MNASGREPLRERKSGALLPENEECMLSDIEHCESVHDALRASFFVMRHDSRASKMIFRAKIFVNARSN